MFDDSVSVCLCVLPDQCVAAGALRTVVQNILQGQREGQALCV